MTGIERWSERSAAALLRRPGPNDDKYRRGVLGMRTGSAAYPGAAVLTVSAAWRTGVGLLRYVPPLEDSHQGFGLPAPAAAVLAVRPETVFGVSGSHSCDAWVIGSGTDPGSRSPAERDALLALLEGDAPVVVDAGALGLVCEAADRRRAPAILTPHGGEFARLWEAASLGPLPDGLDRSTDPEHSSADEDDRTEDERTETRSSAAARLAGRLGASVLLKGSTTVIATPSGRRISTGRATPWLASAGTGDVLAGILGAIVSAHSGTVRSDPESLGPLGATAALLHDCAARIAAGDPKASGSGHPISASGVADALPEAWEALARS